jgi:hypothetical protein
MSKKINKTEEVKNTVLTFNASFYQLDKSKQNKTFEYQLNGSTEKAELKSNAVAGYLSEKVFKVVNAQNNIKEVANKCRFFKLASSKPLYFTFTLNGNKIVNAEIFESIKVKLSGLDNAKQLHVILTEIINIMQPVNDTI